MNVFRRFAAEPEKMAAFYSEVDSLRVLVHCHGGASRTGLVLRGWLRRTEGMSVDEATEHVAERWPHLGLWNASFTAALERVEPTGDHHEGRNDLPDPS